MAFIVYTEAIKNMEVSQLWSVLYFFMLLTLGMGSMVGTGTAILTPLTDSKLISSYLPKEAISGQDTPLRRQGMGGQGNTRQSLQGFLQDLCASKPTPEAGSRSLCSCTVLLSPGRWTRNTSHPRDVRWSVSPPWEKAKSPACTQVSRL